MIVLKRDAALQMGFVPFKKRQQSIRAVTQFRNGFGLYYSGYGEIAERYIRQLDAFYENFSVDKYVIMPDHIHLLVTIRTQGGHPGTGVPTERTSIVARFVSTLKRFCNKEYGENIWQSRYYDHVIRNQQDYNEIWEYIEHNPKKWAVQKYGEEETHLV